MNQQRLRRFRTAKEREDRLNEVKKASENSKQDVHINEIGFDSNAITPGTEFMAKITQFLQLFVQVS
jgi:5'-3' exoribonuclease 1